MIEQINLNVYIKILAEFKIINLVFKSSLTNTELFVYLNIFYLKNVLLQYEGFLVYSVYKKFKIYAIFLLL